jgi:hypothetical protein
VVRAELVQERQRPSLRTPHPQEGSEVRPDVRHRPASAHETDNRRRGRFR